MSGAPSHTEILALWKRSLPELVPDERGLQARLTNPEEFVWRRDAAGQLIAVGVCRSPEMHPYGHLRLLLVHPDHQRRGVGRALVQEMRGRLGPVETVLGQERGHFFAGATPESVPFWESTGFRLTGAEPADLRCDLRSVLPQPNIPADLRVTDGSESGVLDSVLSLTREVFSPRWTADAQSVADVSPSQVLALMRGTRATGFALVGAQGDPVTLPSFLFPEALRRGHAAAKVGGLGPVGLHPEARGTGLGRGLMLAAMHRLKTQGAQMMGVDWTGIAPFYEKLGFTIWRTQKQMRT